MDHVPEIGNLVGYADTRLPVLVIDIGTGTFTGYVYDDGDALIKSGLLFSRITKLYGAEEAKAFFESEAFLQSRCRRRRLKFQVNETALFNNVLKNAGLIPRDPGFERLARIREALEQGSVIAPKR